MLDPEFELGSDPWPDEIKVVENDTRLDLFGGRVVLFFSGARFVPFLPEPHRAFRYYVLAYFLIYRSRVNYSMFWPEVMKTPPAITPSREVTFALRRRVEGNSADVPAAPHPITVSADDFEAVLALGTPQLYLAMAYFLIGCENFRYFLIEFYKALESIEMAFSGESETIRELKPYGLRKDHFKGLKGVANDRRRPLDIGRHAPETLEADLRTIDVRRLLEEPESKDVFASSVASAREAIDAYFAFLVARGRARMAATGGSSPVSS